MILEPKIDMVTHRCFDCGRFWMREVGVNGTCPVCAEKQFELVNLSLAKLERSNRALRGALKRKAHKHA